MIRRILAVCQGPNDVGFLRGLKDRLGCPAELTDASGFPVLRQRGVFTRRAEARLIWDACLRRGIDLIVRLTDADGKPVQQVVRSEIERFPSDCGPFLICGACDRDIEHWLSLDVHYAAQALGFVTSELPEDRIDRSSFIKKRIERTCQQTGESYSDCVARLVRDASIETMKLWLADTAFGHFYDACRRMAAQHDCATKNER